MFQFPAFAPYGLYIQPQVTAIWLPSDDGLPHSEIPGLTVV